MLEHAAVTAADRPQHTDPGDYVIWQHRFRPFRIRLKRGIDSALQAHALAAERSQISSEIGGLLFGGIETHGPEVCITIANAVFVRSKGRFINATVNDRAALVDALQSSADPESKPIGYFRSDLRDQFSLTTEDRQFVINHLPIPHSVSLLIRPFQTGVCMLGVFLWKNNRIQNEFADFDMPLFGSEAQDSFEPIPAIPAVPPSPAASAPAEAVSVSLRRDVTPATTGERKRVASRLVRGLIAATICLSALIVGLLIFISRRPPVQPAAAPATQTTPPATTLVVESDHKPAAGMRGLGLEVSRPAPDQLDVTWDRQLPPNARRGLLDIIDGPKHRLLTLDAAQLRLGRLTYFSSGADISFRLDVLSSKGSPMSEYIRVLGAETYPNSLNVPQRATQVADERAAQVPDENAIPAVKAPVSHESHRFIAAAIPEMAPAVSSLQPELAMALPVPQPPPATATQAPSESPQTKLPIPSARATPKTDVPLNPPPSTGSSLHPPQPSQRVMPKIHDIYPNGLPTARRITVDVIVSPAGKVIQASTAERFGLLSDACVTAAKQWRFVPGSRDKQPVASQYQIVFVFDGRK